MRSDVRLYFIRLTELFDFFFQEALLFHDFDVLCFGGFGAAVTKGNFLNIKKTRKRRLVLQAILIECVHGGHGHVCCCNFVFLSLYTCFPLRACLANSTSLKAAPFNTEIFSRS